MMRATPPARRGIVLCDVRGAEPDAVTVDALARLQLAARRSGREIRLAATPRPSCCALVAFMGLAEVLPEAARTRAGGAGPNSGKSVAVLRKNVNSTIRPSAISSTCSAHGS